MKYYYKLVLKIIAVGTGITGALGVLAYIYREKIKSFALNRLMSQAMSGDCAEIFNTQFKEPKYQKLKMKFVTWNTKRLQEIPEIKNTLRNNKQLSKEEKTLLWRDLTLNGNLYSVFTQVLVNLYGSEIYKMIFLISSHLSARENNSESFEGLLNTQAIKDQLQKYIQGQVSDLFSEIELSRMYGLEEFKSLFQQIQNRLHCVSRVPNPVFEITIVGIPDLGNSEFKEFMFYYCL